MSIFGPRYNDTVNTSYDANFQRGHHIRRNSSISSINNIICGWPEGIYIDGYRSRNNLDTAKTLQIRYDILAGMKKNWVVNNDSVASGFNWAKYVSVWNDAAYHNKPVSSSVNYPMLMDPFKMSKPDFRAKASSPVRNSSYWAVKNDTVSEPKPVVGLKKYNDNGIEIQSWPNPFSDANTISINLSEAGVLTVKVYDVTGVQVAELMNGRVTAGHYQTTFNAPKAGIYLVQVNVNKATKVIKVIAQ